MSFKLGTLNEQLDEVADVNQAIACIILTRKNELPHDPEFGTKIHKYIDSPYDILAPILINEASQAIARYEPRIDLINIKTGVVGRTATASITWRWKAANVAAAREQFTQYTYVPLVPQQQPAYTAQTADFILTAGENIEAFRALYQRLDGRAAYPNPNDPLQVKGIVGVSLNNAIVGQEVKIRFMGIVNNPLWSFAPLTNLPIMLGTSGQLVQRAPNPANTVEKPIGEAVTPYTVVLIPFFKLEVES